MDPGLPASDSLLLDKESMSFPSPSEMSMPVSLASALSSSDLVRMTEAWWWDDTSPSFMSLCMCFLYSCAAFVLYFFSDYM